MTTVLRATAITKRFGDLLANDRVDFEVEPGEIHAVVGENGAGKSTLMNILFGMERPDAGSIEIDGVPTELHNAADAIHAGIGMVHQHFMLVPEFSVTRNVTLGAEPRRLGFINAKASARALAAPMALLGVQFDIRRKARELSVAQQQQVEILKVLYRGARILILDEPTAVLTPQETAELFRTLRSLSRSGVSVIFITHKLREVMEIADRVTVLRQGRTHGTFPLAEVDIPTLVSLMTGRSDVELGRLPRVPPGHAPRLRVEGLSGRQLPDCELSDATLHVREGEIVGIAGVDGNGQNSLVALLTGGARPSAGSIHLDDVRLPGTSIAAHRRRGLGYVPEDRRTDGLPLHAPVVEALAMGRLLSVRGLSLFGPAITRPMKAWARDVISRFGIKVTSLETAPNSLSGGNQQKIVLARELDAQPRLLVMAQPTRGVDLGASEGIYTSILDLASKGAAIIVVSADLDELLRLTDRILVVYRGAIVAEFVAATTSRDELGLAMAGIHQEAA
ncbi:ABC transporter ATP-binding protein [Microbacterium sp. 2FI]|uniref:ABC transporter ATP-binding protein n=1 Tax=Microbacterium sp. 2FI TaxID=2502193 RepID=UPI0010FA380E|nr:ABC transporter ATP-binding protein [Microbacterium sp. 2FI]